jgi:hypothetical protein
MIPTESYRTIQRVASQTRCLLGIGLWRTQYIAIQPEMLTLRKPLIASLSSGCNANKEI